MKHSKFILIIAIIALCIRTNSTNLLSAISNSDVQLPCNITAPWNDSVIVILWYKDSMGTPLYRVDTRKSAGKKQPSHYMHNLLKNRASMHPDGFLHIKNVSVADSGLYRCRVDFNFYKSTNSKHRLQVFAQPNKPIVRKLNGDIIQNQELLGPYKEGQRLVLFCSLLRVKGNPLTRLKWFRGEYIMPENVQNSISVTAKMIKVILNITRLRKGDADFEKKITCRASLLNFSIQSVKFGINMFLKPQSVHIILKNRHVISSKAVNVTCIVDGSVPEPIITWWKRNSKLQPFILENSSLANGSSISILRLIPSSDDNGMFLTCKALNMHYPDDSLQDRIQLSVRYKPELRLTISNQEPSDGVVKNTEIILQCSIKANPLPETIKWYFNDRIIYNSSRQSIANNMLVISNIKIEDDGIYQCSATNMLGLGESNKFNLKVLYPPICKSEHKSYGLTQGDAAILNCNVDANPKDVKFHWTINSSGIIHEIKTFRSQGLHSAATYIPIFSAGFGNIECWAENKAGSQAKSCLFSVYRAEAPESPSNCTVDYSRSMRIKVSCTAGFNGGMPQEFHMKLYDKNLERIIANVSALDSPTFVYDNEEGLHSFRAIIYASNPKGKSRSVTFLMHYNISSILKNEDPDEELNVTIVTIVIVILVVISCIILCIILSLFVFLKRRNRSTAAKQTKEKKTTDEGNFSEVEESNPDVVPTTPVKNDSKLEYLCCCQSLHRKRNVQGYRGGSKNETRCLGSSFNGIQPIMANNEYYLSANKKILEKEFAENRIDDRDILEELSAIATSSTPILRKKCESAV